jgi:hypothetical protein
VLKQKGKCVCLQRELKAGQHKNYPDSGEDDELVIVVVTPRILELNFFFSSLTKFGRYPFLFPFLLAKP